MVEVLVVGAGLAGLACARRLTEAGLAVTVLEAGNAVGGRGFRKDVRLEPGLYVCGDHRDSASIQGALVSGRRAAAAVLADLRAS